MRPVSLSGILGAAVVAGKRPVDILRMTYAQKALIGSGGFFQEDVADVMAIMASGEYDIASIITHEFTQEELPRPWNWLDTPRPR